MYEEDIDELDDLEARELQQILDEIEEYESHPLAFYDDEYDDTEGICY